MSDHNEAKWYVIHTYSGYENKVASDLALMVENRKMQDLILDIKIPTETVTEVKEDKVKEYASATARVMCDEEGVPEKCAICGAPAKHKVIFARAY